jgi:hypothetical protein
MTFLFGELTIEPDGESPMANHDADDATLDTSANSMHTWSSCTSDLIVMGLEPNAVAVSAVNAALEQMSELVTACREAFVVVRMALTASDHVNALRSMVMYAMRPARECA